MKPSLWKALQSQVGRKALNAATGIGLIIFIIVHLAGNLTLFGSPGAFNRYTLQLESLGWLLYSLEFFLALTFILHAAVGISIWRKRRRARPVHYNKFQSRGGPSHMTWYSRSMIFSGIILLIFLVIHLNDFKFADTEMIMIEGEQARDLKSVVVETFTNPWHAFGYSFVMALLGAHLAHGIWSSFTSLSLKRTPFSDKLYTTGVILAILLALGFMFIPLYIYFTGGEGALLSYSIETLNHLSLNTWT